MIISSDEGLCALTGVAIVPDEADVGVEELGPMDEDVIVGVDEEGLEEELGVLGVQCLWHGGSELDVDAQQLFIDVTIPFLLFFTLCLVCVGMGDARNLMTPPFGKQPCQLVARVSLVYY